MKHHWNIGENLMDISYSWKFEQKWNSFSVAAYTTQLAIEPGSDEEFITEHYWGYTPLMENSCSEYGVEHPRWKAYEVKDYKIDVAFDKLYSTKFLFLNSVAPDSVMLAEGSEIAIRSMRKIV